MAGEADDIATLQHLAQIVAYAGDTVATRGEELEASGAADLCERVAARLLEESLQLRQEADRALAIAEENRAKDAGTAEPTPDIYDLFAVVDLRDIGADRRPRRKWYDPDTTFGDTTGNSRRTWKRGICLHHSAVRGGFASHASRRKLYADTPLMEGWFVQPNIGITREEYQHIMALKHRWYGDPDWQSNQGVSYQTIFTLSGVLYFNLPFDWVTWASDGANTHFLSMCWDGHARHDSFDEGGMMRALEVTVEQGEREGHFRDDLELTIHQAWTNKPCPGKVIAEWLVDAAAPKLGAKVDLDFKANARAKSIREVLAG